MIGTVVGNVRLVSEIGQGKLGTVYLAAHINVERQFAVRHLLPQIAQNELYREHFIREATAQFPLKHEKIVQFYNVVEKEDDVFLVMEYVDGETLDKHLENYGALPEDQALPICKDVLEALNFAHSNGVVHRDIRPSNIFITKEGNAKIMDFGIGLMPDGTRLGETGQISLSARYVSPEQITGSAMIDRRSDVYSMGIVTYEMLMGRAPFIGETNSEIYEKHLKATPKKIESISEDLNAIIMKALSKDPAKRFQGCAEFLNRIKAYETGEPKVAEAEEAGLPAGQALAARKALEVKEAPKGFLDKIPHLKIVVAAIAALLIIGMGLFLTMRYIQGNRTEREYRGVMARVQSEKGLEKKQIILLSYIKAHRGSEYAAQAMREMKKISARIEERDFDQTMARAHKWRMDKEYEKARSAYVRFLKLYPSGAYAAEIRKNLTEVEDLMDDRDYKALYAIAESDLGARVDACKSYLANHPKGKYRDRVGPLLAQLSDAYFKQVKDELNLCEKREDWKTCVRLSEDFVRRYKGDARGKEIGALLEDFRKKLKWKGELDSLIARAEAKGRDYSAAKQVYLEYLKTGPPPYLKGKIQNEIARLERRRQWQSLLAFVADKNIDRARKIERLKAYLEAHPGGAYKGKAESLLRDLEKKEQAALASAEVRRREREKREWQNLSAMAANSEINVFERIKTLEDYIEQGPPDRYLLAAKAKLKVLREEGERWTRLKNIEKQLKAQLKAGASVFVDNADGTVLDKRTGLTWCLLDSFDELNRCLNFNGAVKYVNNLNTGGHKDWRLPTARELALIYKSKPFFPCSGQRWYWTSEMLGKGMTAKVYIVNSKRDGIFKMDNTSVRNCGTVRAVRK